MTFAARIFAAAILLIVASPRGAWAADPVEVFIDGRDPAYVIVQGVAADTPDSAVREMAGYATLEGVSLVGWDVFRQGAEALIAPHIVKVDYPGVSLVPAVVALVKTYPGRPFAVTWNGGLAVSFQDYQYAAHTHKSYLEDAEGYEQNRLQGAAIDPLNPQNHLPALLNR